MILKPAHERLFFKLMEVLTDYANERYDILGHPYDQTPRNKKYDEERTLILEKIWNTEEIIPEFLKENPAKLSSHERECVKQWQYALTRSFIVANHEDGYAHFLADDYVYAVSGLSKEISSMLRETPCFVTTTLLPFEGTIVYDSQIKSSPIAFAPQMIELFTKEYEQAKAHGKVYRSAAAFINNSEYHREVAHQRKLNEQIDDYRAEKRKEDPDYDMPKGMHMGRLSGLTFEEREATIKETIKEMGNDPEDGDEYYFRRSLDKLSTDIAPDNIKAALSATTKDELMVIARAFEIPKYGKLKKTELVERLKDNEDLLEGLLVHYYLDVDDQDYKLFIDLLDNDGKETQLASELTSNDLLPHSPPFVFNYRQGNQVITKIPREIMDYIKAYDTEYLAFRHDCRTHIKNLAFACVALYGLISLADFLNLHETYYPEDGYDISTLSAELIHMLSTHTIPYELWYDTSEQPYPVDEDDVANDQFFDTVYLINPALVNNYLYDPSVSIDFNDEENDEMQEAVEAYRYHLVERHDEIPRKLLEKEEIENFFILDYVRAIPEVRELLQYLDSHVPDDEDDLFFADGALLMIMDGVNHDYPPQFYIEIFSNKGYSFESIDNANDLLGVITKAVNAMPRWSNNGHSPMELYEQYGL